MYFCLSADCVSRIFVSNCVLIRMFKICEIFKNVIANMLLEASSACIFQFPTTENSNMADLQTNKAVANQVTYLACKILK